MRVLILGGGPGGLYSALLIKKAQPEWEISVIERNPPDATYGWGIVFSDQTLTSFREADYPTYKEITDRFAIWNVIEVRHAGQVTRCGGNVFSGMSRKLLLELLQSRCRELGVSMTFHTEVADLSFLDDYDLVIAADGVNSIVRRTYSEHFRPRIRLGKAKYVWFGTTQVFDAFNFIFRESEHGLFQAHVYPHFGMASTMVILCDERTWRRAGLDRASEAESREYCERVFAEDLGGHSLLTNKSEWLTFPTVRNQHWRYRHIVLLGDAAHTADFTIGSGTKIAMEDAIALANALERRGRDIEAALADYELERRPTVEGLQEAALESAGYFENIDRYVHFEPLQFAYHLLTRSSRVTYDELRRRDSIFVEAVNRWYYVRCGGNAGSRWPIVAPPPAFTPIACRGMKLSNRVVASPRPTDSSRDGLPSEIDRKQWVDLGLGGAGLVLGGPIAVSPEGRITPGCPGLYRREHAAALAQIVEFIRARSPSKLGIVLGHSGRRGATRPRAEGLDRPLAQGAWEVLSASPLPYTPRSPVPKEMAAADMRKVLDDFVRSARMADEAGFDVIELHFGHGYLLASFLSPLTNHRGDAYGGSLENRMRFPLEVLDAVRAAWRADKPIAVAISASDLVKEGFEIEEGVRFAGVLKEHGCDLIHVLAGQITPEATPTYRPRFLTLLSDQVRNEAHVPTLCSAYVSTTNEVNDALAAGRADLCMLYPPRLDERAWQPESTS